MQPKHIKAALFISLALNLFLGGVMLGRLHAPPGRWMQKDQSALQSLSSTDRDALKLAARASKQQRDILRRELDEERAHVQEAVQSGDARAIDEATAAEAQKKAQILKLMQKNREDALSRLSPEGRATVEKMTKDAETRFQDWRDRHGPRSHDPGMPPDFMADLGGPDDPDF